MYSVLVPVDESVERAERQASFVASLPDANSKVEALVMYVKEADYQGAPDLALEDVDSAMVAIESLEEAGVSCEGRLLKGMVAKNILEAADEIDAEVIVMGGRKRSGVSKVVLGSITQDIVLSADRPVTILG